MPERASAGLGGLMRYPLCILAAAQRKLHPATDTGWYIVTSAIRYLKAQKALTNLGKRETRRRREIVAYYKRLGINV